ncbi:MAG: hypothetical protein VYB15_01250, partial [Planctomycetota bacterium]|nr:hypothetical protein [Planctomycetota bacterium]
MNRKLAAVTGCLALLLFAARARSEDVFKACADLPPLLQFNDGSEVKTAGDLKRRKREVAALLKRYFIGTFPEKGPGLVSAKVLDERRAEDGSLRRRVQLTFDTPQKASFEVRVWVPKGEGPFPVLLTQPRYYQLRWAELALERGYIACLYPGVDSHHREKDFPRYESVWQDFRREYPKATWSEISTKAWLAG